MKQTTDTSGGGRFLYYERIPDTSAFTLTVRTSTFKCYTAAFTEATLLPLIRTSTFDQGSAFHIDTGSKTATVDMTGSTISNCYSGYWGGAIYVTSTGAKYLTLSGNTFSKNAALEGGAIFCSDCYWTTLASNTFYYNIAQTGADISIREASQYPVTI